ncbi:F-box/kelch-repeat protein At3g06240-like isoform X1 [Rosa rugosa]|uniref:F-box/kelch-repeat protein At3g06240-like isoform X1 n=1 Tax=Rosa rugosa TaxID=74645 RepID=UPI002B40400C|nr:F-box/kelch-repeat protein At3g06240-like isoform X1 [Rosa rugosa]
MSDALCTRLQQQVVLSGTAPSSESLDLDCVIDDILSRLPAKSLLRFRCVCKAWRALISDPYFIRKHLSCIDTKISTSYSLLIKEQIFRSAEYEAILKCLSHDGPLPSRRLDFLVLPQPSLWSQHFFSGFGYDSTSNDYKVILASHTSSNEFDVVVFTLKSGSWRKLGRLNRYSEVSWVSLAGCLVNEALHWVLEEEDDRLITSRIVSFDLAEEKFYEIPLPFPPSPVDRPTSTAEVGILNNCLTLYFQTMSCEPGRNFKVWVLKDYGVKKSWIEVISIPSEVLDVEYMYMTCISENGEVLMRHPQSGSLALYNPKEKTSRIVLDYGGCWYHTATYIETLVSPLTGSTGARM